MKSKLLYIGLGCLIVALVCLSIFLMRPKPHVLGFRQASFAELPGWQDADTKKSLAAFQLSCKAFLKQAPDRAVGSQYIELQAKDWHPACRAAMLVDANSKEKTRAFFQTWFTPVEFFDKESVHGLFTGYYMPLLQGSLTKTDEYNVPIYALPNNLVTVNLGLFDPSLRDRTLVGRVVENKILPFYTREAINKGAIKETARVVAWVNSKIDRSFLEIQGSGIIKLPDGKELVIGYAGENGASYTPIARVLIDQGVMTFDNASMQHIRRYLEANPDQIDPVLNQNKSFVFFNELRQNAALGSQGVALTPGYSMAIDRKWIPLGAPVWLSTTRPDHHSSKQKRLQRLMIAQDTGGAIRGVVRGDVYWGAGKRATAIAGKMKNKGYYWLLLPRNSLHRLHDKFVT